MGAQWKVPRLQPSVTGSRAVGYDYGAPPRLDLLELACVRLEHALAGAIHLAHAAAHARAGLRRTCTLGRRSLALVTSRLAIALAARAHEHTK